MVKEYDKILFRLTDILTKLSNGETPSLQELAHEYNVSVRTLQRDIYTRLNKFPIIVNASKKLQFMEGFSLNRMRLSIEEMMTVTLSLELIQNKGTEFHKASQNLMNKMLYTNVFSPYYIKPTASESIDTESSLLNSLEEAIASSQWIRIGYKTGESATLMPLKIVNFDGFWYLLAKDETEVSIELISIIAHMKVLNERFSLSEFEKKLFERVHSPFFTTKPHFHVRLKINSKVAHYFKLKQYLPSQTILEEKSDGSLIVEYGVTHIEEIDNLVKSWFPDIQIVEPKEYKEAFEAELKSYLTPTQSTQG